MTQKEIQTFLANEIGGGGKKQATVGRVPSSLTKVSTLKHLKLLRSDFLKELGPWFWFLSGLNPPKSGAPGVPGVAGVDGADPVSSLSISHFLQLNKH